MGQGCTGEINSPVWRTDWRKYQFFERDIVGAFLIAVSIEFKSTALFVVPA
jgi:hypothetical protein